MNEKREEKSADVRIEVKVDGVDKDRKATSEERKLKIKKKFAKCIEIPLKIEKKESISLRKEIKDDDITVKDTSPDKSPTSCTQNQGSICQRKTMIITKKRFCHNYNKEV